MLNVRDHLIVEYPVDFVISTAVPNWNYQLTQIVVYTMNNQESALKLTGFSINIET